MLTISSQKKKIIANIYIILAKELSTILGTLHTVTNLIFIMVVPEAGAIILPNLEKNELKCREDNDFPNVITLDSDRGRV